MKKDRTRVKVCGLTREEDVDAAVAAGADSIGMVFYGPSRRCLSLDRAAQLRLRVPAFVSVTALFVNPEADAVRSVLERVGPDMLQFHGEETAEFCRQFGRRYLKAFRVGAPGLDSAAALARHCQAYADAAGWLFDSYSTVYGGSGLGFDATLLAQVPREAGAPVLVLAGGLTPANVGDRIRHLAPYAVDVSSGVESAPGIKDGDQIRSFLRAVQKTDMENCV
jgi:phosphoribosylanthranilate isomerase